MRSLPTTQDEGEFRLREDRSPKEEFKRFLRGHGFPSGTDLPVDEEGDIVVSELLDELPETLRSGNKNRARMALKDFYEAIDSKLKAKGFTLEPDALLSILLERVELHYYIAQESVRTCTGRRCDDFDECPFSDVAKHYTREDNIDCMVDKEVVNRMTREYLKTPDNPDGKIDPRQTAQASLFKALVKFQVIENRVTMRLKQDPVLVKKWEVLQDGPIEHFDSKNYTEHPLLQRWVRIQKEIRKLMKEMGISPREEIRQDRWEAEEEGESAQRRGEEIAKTLLKKTAREKIDELPEGSQRRKILEEVVKEAEEKAGADENS